MMSNLVTFVVVAVVGVALHITRRLVTGPVNDRDVRTRVGEIRTVTVNVHKIRRHLAINLEVIVHYPH